MKPDIVVFRDDDGGFHDWLDQNPDGYFLNLINGQAVLHLSKCSHFDRSPASKWTDTAKVCGETQFILSRWANQEGAGDLVPCGDCFR